MTDYPVAECRSCRARIVWTTDAETGRRAPIDAKPVPDGNVVLVTGNNGPESRVLSADDAKSRQERGLTVWQSHFRSCPDSESWRKSKKADARG